MLPNIDIKKMALNGKLVDVVSLDAYTSKPDAYVQNTTTIEVAGYALPIIGRYDRSPGISIGETFSYVNLPSDEEKEIYTTSSDKFIDMSNPKDIGDLMQKQEAVRNIEREILTTPDNIYVCKRNPTDTAAMTGMKDAVDAKKMDISKYAPRFGPNYNNDRRKLEDDRISMTMLERLGNKFDMKVSLVFEDANPNVPNPMGEPITVVITGNMGGEEDD